MRELGLDAFRFSIAWPRDRPGGARPGEPGGARLLRPARRRAARARHRAVRRRSTTGICRRRSRTRAAGRRARPPRRSSSTPRRSRRGSATASRTGSRTTSRGSPPGSGTARATTRPGGTSPRRRARGRAPPAALARLGGRGAAARVAPGRGRHHARPQPTRTRRATATRTAVAAEHGDGFFNRWFLDPLFRGSYPADILEYFAPSRRRLRRFRTAISRRSRRRSTSSASTTTRARCCARTRTAADRPSCAIPTRRTPAMDWEIYPDGLYDLLVRRAATTTTRRRSTSPRTAPRSATTRRTTGRSTTPSGTAYLEAHLDAVGRAIEAGVPMARLLRLVAARQLRVGARLLEALRDRLRRLPDARARAEGELPLVSRLHRGEPERQRGGVALVEGAATGEPLGRLPRHARNRVEVTVVVEEDRSRSLGDSGNEQVDQRRPSMLTGRSESNLVPARQARSRSRRAEGPGSAAEVASKAPCTRRGYERRREARA